MPWQNRRWQRSRRERIVPRADSPDIMYRVICLIGLCLVLFSCGTLRDSIDAITRQYIRLAVALGERDPDSLDFYFGPADWVADVRSRPPSFLEIQSGARSLQDRLATLPLAEQDSTRVKFLSAQLGAIRARAQLLTGVHSSFDEESRLFFAIEPPADEDTAAFTAVRRQLAALLPGSGPLARRYSDFERRFTIPPERLRAVFERAIDGCRARTLAHVELPPGEGITIEYTANRPWDGYSTYQGRFRSLVRVNVDFPLTVDRALALACHESYPGHHVYNSLQDLNLVQMQHRTELMVQPVYSPQSFASEAVAAMAFEMAFPELERLAFERDELFPPAGLDPALAINYMKVEDLVAQLQMAQIPIARRYLDGKLEFVRAGELMEEDLLMSSSEATLKYLNEYRTYMLTYTFGKDLLTRCIAGEHDRWKRYRDWMTSGDAIAECIARPRVL